MRNGFYRAAEPDAAVAPLLQQVWPEVEREMRLHDGLDATIHTELRAQRRPDGGAGLRRFYWSTQHADSGSELGFAARTLYCDAKDPALRVHEFPSEPTLTTLGDVDGPLRLTDRPAGVQILRYIPLRRVTFRLRGAEGLPDSVIAKVKPAGGLSRAASAFLTVHEAARLRGAGALRVPRVLRHDPRRRLLCLEEMPGQPLDVALHGLHLTDAMEQLGTAHRDLHELEVGGELPQLGTADWLADARHAATQIGLFVPSVATAAEAAYADLVRTAPADGRLRYCQGDFLPGQILCDPGGWSVIDLDDSRYADPLSEVAVMYVALPREHGIPPVHLEHARRTYLEAYARRAGEGFDGPRLSWFVRLAELGDLGKRLFKGRAAPGEAQEVLDRLTTPERLDLP